MPNVEPVMMRGAPPGLENRSSRRPLPLEAAGGRAYLDPGFRSVASYVLEGRDGANHGDPPAIVDPVANVGDARLDCRAYLVRHADRRR